MAGTGGTDAVTEVETGKGGGTGPETGPMTGPETGLGTGTGRDPAPALGVDVTDPRTGVRGEGVTEIESSRKC